MHWIGAKETTDRCIATGHGDPVRPTAEVQAKNLALRPLCIIYELRFVLFGDWNAGILVLHRESEKGATLANHGDNFVNSWSICKILSQLQRAVKFSTKPVLGYPTHLTYVAELPWKTLKSEIWTLHARKHVSNDMWLFIICPTDICQMS